MLYICLLRAINVGGKNLVSMNDLRNIFEGLDYSNVTTIGNTGNILFETNQRVSDSHLAKEIANSTGLDLKIAILTFDELKVIMEDLPKWWHTNKDWRHNAIFMLNQYPTTTIAALIETSDSEIEKGMVYTDVILWSSSFAERTSYYKTQYSKLLKNKAYPYLTIRNANTLNKIYNQAKKMMEQIAEQDK